MRLPDEQGNLGKYDNAAEVALFSTGAKLVLMMVIDGSEGDGFSVSGSDPRLLHEIPSILRDVASKIEEQMKSVPRN